MMTRMGRGKSKTQNITGILSDFPKAGKNICAFIFDEGRSVREWGSCPFTHKAPPRPWKYDFSVFALPAIGPEETEHTNP